MGLHQAQEPHSSHKGILLAKPLLYQGHAQYSLPRHAYTVHFAGSFQAMHGHPGHRVFTRYIHRAAWLACWGSPCLRVEHSKTFCS